MGTDPGQRRQPLASTGGHCRTLEVGTRDGLGNLAKGMNLSRRLVDGLAGYFSRHSERNFKVHVLSASGFRVGDPALGYPRYFYRSLDSSTF